MAHSVVSDARTGPDAPLWAPFVDSMPVTGASIELRRRWPALAAEAERHGFHSVHAPRSRREVRR